MKKIVGLALIALFAGCKKKEVKPQEPTPYVCQTKTKVFEGKYETQSDSKDTITIVFIHNNCPTEASNTYSVYGLGKAYNNALGSNLDVNKVYEIKSNEDAKSATTTGISCNLSLDNVGITFNYNNVGVLGFKKL